MPVRPSEPHAAVVSLGDLVNTAEVLQLADMLEVVCAKLATMIRGRTVAQVSAEFGEDREVSAEALAKVYAEIPWLQEA